VIAVADILKAIVAAWDASTLNDTFKALWSGSIVAADFVVLHDTEASPNQPFPYCVMEIEKPTVRERMSSAGDYKREIREQQFTFNVHAKEGSSSAKVTASNLVAAIMAVFGGHPTTKPTATLTLDNGNHLLTQYVNDYSIRTEQDRYQWSLTYKLLVDVPVAV
jgi:hypothetical protein